MSPRTGNCILFGLLALVPLGKCTRGEFHTDWPALGFTFLGMVPTILWWLFVLWLGATGLAILKWMIKD